MLGECAVALFAWGFSFFDPGVGVLFWSFRNYFEGGGCLVNVLLLLLSLNSLGGRGGSDVGKRLHSVNV